MLRPSSSFSHSQKRLHRKDSPIRANRGFLVANKYRTNSCASSKNESASRKDSTSKSTTSRRQRATSSCCPSMMWSILIGIKPPSTSGEHLLLRRYRIWLRPTVITDLTRITIPIRQRIREQMKEPRRESAAIGWEANRTVLCRSKATIRRACHRSIRWDNRRPSSSQSISCKGITTPLAHYIPAATMQIQFIQAICRVRQWVGCAKCMKSAPLQVTLRGSSWSLIWLRITWLRVSRWHAIPNWRRAVRPKGIQWVWAIGRLRRRWLILVHSTSRRSADNHEIITNRSEISQKIADPIEETNHQYNK